MNREGDPPLHGWHLLLWLAPFAVSQARRVRQNRRPRLPGARGRLTRPIPGNSLTRAAQSLAGTAPVLAAKDALG
jgi:hypothetical protein